MVIEDNYDNPVIKKTNLVDWYDRPKPWSALRGGQSPPKCLLLLVDDTVEQNEVSLIALLILNISSGTLLALLALPMLRSKIRPNLFYGFRVARTLEDPDLWYAVNKHFAVRMIFSGASIVLSSILLYFVPGISVDIYALACAAVFGVVFTAGLMQSFRYLKSLSTSQK
ncbi:MAG: SdpI family protein [Chloroflexota bacterium]|nr:MAG: SdpI family protein [Chloroflexota bacterium]